MTPLTRWSLIVRSQGTGLEARTALNELIRRYDQTVLALIRHRGHPPHQTPEDLKQEFFTRVLGRNDLARLDQTRGHFRGWLRTAVERFLRNEWDHWFTTSAGFGVTQSLCVDRAHALTPERQYLSAYAWDTLLHVLRRQRDEAADRTRFDDLKRFLPGPQVDLEAQATVARSLGMTRVALAVAICRLREDFRTILRGVVAETIDIDPSQPEAAAEIARETALLYRYMRELPWFEGL